MQSRTFGSRCPTLQVKLGRRVAATAMPPEKRITSESVQLVDPSVWMGRMETRRAIAMPTRPIGAVMNQTSAASPGGKRQSCVQSKSSQEAARKAPLVTTRQPAVVYPAMRPGFEMASGGGHRSRRREFRRSLGFMGENRSHLEEPRVFPAGSVSNRCRFVWASVGLYTLTSLTILTFLSQTAPQASPLNVGDGHGCDWVHIHFPKGSYGRRGPRWISSHRLAGITTVF
jgi:hypothetical protein